MTLRFFFSQTSSQVYITGFSLLAINVNTEFLVKPEENAVDISTLKIVRNETAHACRCEQIHLTSSDLRL